MQILYLRKNIKLRHLPYLFLLRWQLGNDKYRWFVKKAYYIRVSVALVSGRPLIFIMCPIISRFLSINVTYSAVPALAINREFNPLFCCCRYYSQKCRRKKTLFETIIIIIADCLAQTFVKGFSKKINTMKCNHPGPRLVYPQGPTALKSVLPRTPVYCKLWGSATPTAHTYSPLL